MNEGPVDGRTPTRPRGRPTIVDLAREAGVSKSTVSLVLNGSSLVKPATREKVEAAVRSLGYVYNRSAAGLRSTASDLVGVVVNDLGNPFFAQMMLGVERALRSSGCTPLLASTDEDPVQQRRLLHEMLERGACGFVLSAATGTDPAAFASFGDWRVPIVAAMRDVPSGHAHLGAVVPDNAGGAREAVRHLVSLGHRRIAFLGAREGMVARADRLSGFRSGLREAGLEPAAELESPVSRQGGADAMARLLGGRAEARATAVLCFNDLVAMGASHAAERYGLRVGTDLALVGFDDIDEARWMRPSLTTARVNAPRIGELAVDELVRGLGGEPLRRVVCPTTLVVRGSCGGRDRASADREVCPLPDFIDEDGPGRRERG